MYDDSFESVKEIEEIPTITVGDSTPMSDQHSVHHRAKEIESPLMTFLECLSFYAAKSYVEPLSALINNLQADIEGNKGMLNSMLSLISHEGSHSAVISYLLKLLQPNQPSDRIQLVLQSAQELAINDVSVSNMVVDNYDTIIQFIEDPNFTSDVLELFETTCAQAQDRLDIIKDIIAKLFVIEKKYQKSREMRSKFFKVYAAVSLLPDVFSKEHVHDISNRLNYCIPDLVEPIVESCITCVCNIIQTGNTTKSYKCIEEKISVILPKLSHALQKANNSSSELLLLIMRAIMFVFSEFSSLFSVGLFGYELGARLMSLTLSDSPDVRELAEILIDHFGNIRG